MACHFTLPFTGAATALFNKLQSGIEGQGGMITGDAVAGSFLIPSPVGQINGSYRIASNIITVDISDKPFLLGCKTIESFVRDFIKSDIA